jgi:hypothetical protein
VIKLAVSVEAFEAIAPTFRDEAEANERGEPLIWLEVGWRIGSRLCADRIRATVASSSGWSNWRREYGTSIGKHRSLTRGAVASKAEGRKP